MVNGKKYDALIQVLFTLAGVRGKRQWLLHAGFAINASYCNIEEVRRFYLPGCNVDKTCKQHPGLTVKYCPARLCLSMPTPASPPRFCRLQVWFGLQFFQRPLCNCQTLYLLNDISYQQLLNERGFPTEGSNVSPLCPSPSLLENHEGPNEKGYLAAISQDSTAVL